ncbi:MAG: histidine kinase [Candidatus Azobacteroides sp.]|nr:histidine kinase [Candidatus Azobacteroides sp.]
MKKSLLTIRTAFSLSLAISLTLNILFIIIFIYGRDGVMPSDGRPPQPVFSVYNAIINILSNFFLSFILYILNFQLLKNNDFAGKKKLLIIIFSSLGVTFLLSYLFSTFHILVSDFPPKHPERLFHGGFVRDFFISVIVMFSAQLIHLQHKKQSMELENQTLLSENMRTRYEVLKNQVDPHFLFNTLNTLATLVKMDQNKAVDYIHELSNVFRYTLQNTETVTLTEELKFTGSFFNLMKMRYGDNLKLEEKIDNRYMDSLVIPLSIQTLIENAIKHNVVSNKTPLTIYVTTHEDNTLSVSNFVQAKREKEPGEGIGLTNLAERYKLKWGKKITIYNSDNMFTVNIPLIPA